MTELTKLATNRWKSSTGGYVVVKQNNGSFDVVKSGKVISNHKTIGAAKKVITSKIKSLKESYFDGFLYRKKMLDIYKNPTKSELKTIIGDNDDFRLWLVGDDVYAWNSYMATHEAIASHFPSLFDNVSIPIRVMFETGNEVFAVPTTTFDNMDRLSAEQIRNKIINNRYLKKTFSKIHTNISENQEKILEFVDKDDGIDDYGTATWTPTRNLAGGKKTWKDVAQSIIKKYTTGRKIDAKTVKMRDDFNELMVKMGKNHHAGDWYARHKKKSEEIFGVWEPTFQRCLAATSANAGGPSNFKYGLKATLHIMNGGSFDTYEDFPGVMGQVRANLKRVASGQLPSGFKLEKFARALEGDWSVATPDRWMRRFIFANPTDGPNKAQNELVQFIFDVIADKLGWSQSEAQAAAWVTVMENDVGIHRVWDYAQFLDAQEGEIRKAISEIEKEQAGLEEETINEGRDAPLYHSTYLYSIENILKSDKLDNRTNHTSTDLLKNKSEDKKSGVSLTRNKNFAERWGTIIIELDQRKLAQNHQIIPVDYFQARRPRTSEFEEFVIGPIKNLKKYIKRIYIGPAFKNHMESWRDDPDVYGRAELEQILGSIKALLSYSKTIQIVGIELLHTAIEILEKTNSVFESFDAGDEVVTWIRHFRKSKNPMFDGDDKHKRWERAVAAWMKSKGKKKETINEGRDAPLYHTTKMDNFEKIILSNELKAVTSQKNTKLLRKNKPKTDGSYYDTGPNSVSCGVSLTRSIDFAKKWNYSERFIIELDQRKLAASGKLIPVEYWQDEDSKHMRRVEAEEFHIGPIKNLKKYVKKIRFLRDPDSYLRDHIVDWYISGNLLNMKQILKKEWGMSIVNEKEFDDFVKLVRKNYDDRNKITPEDEELLRQLKESFDTAYEYKQFNTMDHASEAKNYDFKDDMENDIRVTFNRYPNVTEFSFSVNGSIYKMDGVKTNHMQIFSTIEKIFAEHMSKYKPTSIFFAVYRSMSSKVNLYEAIIKKILPKYNYTLDKFFINNLIVFALSKTEEDQKKIEARIQKIIERT